MVVVVVERDTTCSLEFPLQSVAARKPLVVVLGGCRRRDMHHHPTRARTRSLQLVLLQGDPHGAVPGHRGFVRLPNHCCNIRHAPRGARASGPQLPVPQQ